jgi:hypothetical protein
MLHQNLANNYKIIDVSSTFGGCFAALRESAACLYGVRDRIERECPRACGDANEARLKFTNDLQNRARLHFAAASLADICELVFFVFWEIF